MSERPDWRDCLHRPALCGEKLESADVEEEMGETADAQREGRTETSAEAPTSPPPAPLAFEPAPADGAEVPIRHKGLVFSSYWLVVNDIYAGVGDVVVMKSAGEYVIIRRVPRSRHWVDDSRLRIAGVVERRLCIYGFVLQRDVERIAAELRSGRYALVAACDPRAVVRPPRREELYNIWRFEGYLVNTAPAKMALVRLDPSRRPKFAVDFLKKGCPIYSQHLNQILQLSGIPIQLTC